jgi:hypothetical protein
VTLRWAWDKSKGERRVKGLETLYSENKLKPYYNLIFSYFSLIRNLMRIKTILLFNVV